MNLFIRKALPSDAPEICEMVRTAFAEYAAMVGAADLPALHETLEATLQDIRQAGAHWLRQPHQGGRYRAV